MIKTFQFSFNGRNRFIDDVDIFQAMVQFHALFNGIDNTIDTLHITELKLKDENPSVNGLPDPAEKSNPNAVCQTCGKVRFNEPDYTPLQAVTGQPLGWYSSEKDGELCPQDMAKLMNEGNQTRMYRPWLSE